MLLRLLLLLLLLLCASSNEPKQQIVREGVTFSASDVSKWLFVPRFECTYKSPIDVRCNPSSRSPSRSAPRTETTNNNRLTTTRWVAKTQSAIDHAQRPILEHLPTTRCFSEWLLLDVQHSAFCTHRRSVGEPACEPFLTGCLLYRSFVDTLVCWSVIEPRSAFLTQTQTPSQGPSARHLVVVVVVIVIARCCVTSKPMPIHTSIHTSIPSPSPSPSPSGREGPMTSFHLAIHHLAQACSAYQLDCSRSTNKRTNQRHVRDDFSVLFSDLLRSSITNNNHPCSRLATDTTEWTLHC